MKDFSNDIYCYYLLRISVMVISKSHWTQLNLSTRLSFPAGAKSQSWPDQILNVLLITAVTPSRYSLIIHSGRLYDSVKTEFSSSPVTVLLAPNHCSQVSFLFPRPWSHWSPQQCYFFRFYYWTRFEMELDWDHVDDIRSSWCKTKQRSGLETC